MDRKTITIQTNIRKKGKLDQRLFTCHVVEHGNQRFYSLDDTKRDLGLKRFSLDEGCRDLLSHSENLLHRTASSSLHNG